MTFLALNIGKETLMLAKDQLELEELEIMEEYNEISEEMAAYLDENGHSVNDSKYVELTNKQKIFDTKKTSIEAQLQTINSEIDGYKDAVKSNIKSECKLSISA